MPQKITIKGADKLVRELAALSEEAAKAAQTAVAEAAEAIRVDAQAGVPVDTGALRDSITAEIEADGLSANVGPGGDAASYGTHVEFGTSSRPAQPYMQPAAEAETRKFPERITQHVKGAIG